MLVLARRLNQSILIGEEVEIVVVEIKGDQVKLGIKAPKNVSVHRAEVLKEIQEENKKAKADILPTNLSELGNIIKNKK
ncbi:MAG TPA: carbon storage regulator CsrA [Leptospiraceae bacterium]|nr:carbon storage regulator CsrA [Leptospiraceae bacterium]HMY69057.1 carbon storage regulator CsrA [Leptospiraceae bacterium]HNF16258.1 carbon storage regulator CsrA [Leptospiraceae bacterium]HNF24454.1 carbon storage regulator CsrA [Leptospiraceae bacterium]HNI96790.1 carbon storage regulator CsrA [Leptospiraceae bacterium]